MSDSILDRIRKAICGQESVSRTEVEQWMKTDDLKVLSELRYLISIRQGDFEPAFSDKEVNEFELAFLEWCLVENPEGLQNRSYAARAVIDLFKYDPYTPDLEDETLVQSKDWIAHLYTTSNQEVRDALAWAMKHILRRRHWREFFADWMQNPELCTFYERVSGEAASISDESTLEEVETALVSGEIISYDQVRRWMNSPDIEVLGAVANLVFGSFNWDRIEPLLSEQEFESFLFTYYKRCLLEDPVGDWAANRYDAAREILAWFQAVPETEDTNTQTFLIHLRDWMAQVYVEGDKDVRDAITCGALEHILEEPRWRLFFDEWCNDPVLYDAYNHAMSWGVEHEEQPKG